jgi:hypothetical protein
MAITGSGPQSEGIGRDLLHQYRAKTAAGQHTAAGAEFERHPPPQADARRRHDFISLIKVVSADYRVSKYV